MLSLQKHHITDLFVMIDDIVPKKSSALAGRHSLLSDSELVTILIWNSLTVKQKTLKDIWNYTRIHLDSEFPDFPQYNTFVEHCHRTLGLLLFVLGTTLSEKEPIKFVDSTMLEVCKNHRADNYKVAKELAAFGKNHQGWHFGFKLHAAIDRDGNFCGLTITPANTHDAQKMPEILGKNTKVAVGDGAYNASVMNRYLWEEFGTIVIAPPHHKQRKKLMTGWQKILLSMRSKIESVFDYLKEHLNLVSSFPRSAKGYLLHYIRIILGYQLMTTEF